MERAKIWFIVDLRKNTIPRWFIEVPFDTLKGEESFELTEEGNIIPRYLVDYNIIFLK